MNNHACGHNIECKYFALIVFVGLLLFPFAGTAEEVILPDGQWLSEKIDIIKLAPGEFLQGSASHTVQIGALPMGSLNVFLRIRDDNGQIYSEADIPFDLSLEWFEDRDQRWWGGVNYKHFFKFSRTSNRHEITIPIGSDQPANRKYKLLVGATNGAKPYEVDLMWTAVATNVDSSVASEETKNADDPYEPNTILDADTSFSASFRADNTFALPASSALSAMKGVGIIGGTDSDVYSIDLHGPGSLSIQFTNKGQKSLWISLLQPSGIYMAGVRAQKQSPDGWMAPGVHTIRYTNVSSGRLYIWVGGSNYDIMSSYDLLWTTE